MNSLIAGVTKDSEKNQFEAETDERQLGGARPRFVSAILGSLTVLTATLTLYRFIESRGARERQAYFNSLIEDLAEMLEALNLRVSAQENNLKQLRCRYDIELGRSKDVTPECKEYASEMPFDYKAQELHKPPSSPVSVDSPEAQLWFRGLENNNISKRRSMSEVKI